MKKIVSVLMSAVFAVTSLTTLIGCKKKESNMGFIDGHKYPETLKVRMISRDLYHNNGENIGDRNHDEVVKYFEDKFNVRFEFMYTPSPAQSEVYEKINMMILTGDLPDILEMRNDMPLATDIYESLHENDMIVNAKQYVNERAEQYPTLHGILNSEKTNSVLFKNKDGELSMIPRFFGTIDHGFIMRKDWIDQYNGGKVPETYIELEEMLRNFKNAKPDGIEQIGLSLPNTWWLSHLYIGFTNSNTWAKNAEGKYEYSIVTDGQRDAYEWIHKMYSEKLLDNGIFTKKDEKDAIGEMIAGRSGCIMMSAPFAASQLKASMGKDMPELCFANISGPKAKMRMYLSEYFQGCAINSSFKDIPRLFDMIEYILSPEGEEIMCYGLEGIHYTKEGDKKIVNEERRKAEGWDHRRHGLSSLFDVSSQGMLADLGYPQAEELEAFIKTLNEPNATIANPLLGIMTEAEKEAGSKPWDIAGKYTIGFINGTYSLDRWDEFVYEINNAGLSAIVNEVNEKYA